MADTPDFRYRQLAYYVAFLAEMPEGLRAKNTALATEILARLKAWNLFTGDKDGVYAYYERLKSTGPEPWGAFTSPGPGLAPPATFYLSLTPEQRAQTEGIPHKIWTAFKTWTGPGMIYTVLAEGKLPANGLTEAMEQLVDKSLDKVGDLASGVLWPLAILAGVGLVAYIMVRR